MLIVLFGYYCLIFRLTREKRSWCVFLHGGHRGTIGREKEFYGPLRASGGCFVNERDSVGAGGEFVAEKPLSDLGTIPRRQLDRIERAQGAETLLALSVCLHAVMMLAVAWSSVFSARSM